MALFSPFAVTKLVTKAGGKKNLGASWAPPPALNVCRRGHTIGPDNQAWRKRQWRMCGSCDWPRLFRRTRGDAGRLGDPDRDNATGACRASRRRHRNDGCLRPAVARTAWRSAGRRAVTAVTMAAAAMWPDRPWPGASGRLCRRWIERIDAKTGDIRKLYTEVGGNRLWRPTTWCSMNTAAFISHRSRQTLCAGQS